MGMPTNSSEILFSMLFRLSWSNSFLTCQKHKFQFAGSHKGIGLAFASVPRLVLGAANQKLPS